MDALSRIEDRLEPLRQELLTHRLYDIVDRPEALRLFMSHHVFAVWDFMSLLKTLQQRLTGTGVPWLPAVDEQACRFVNEIVLAEESDEDGDGGYASHYELYRRSMHQFGAETRSVDEFVNRLRAGSDVADALAHEDVPAAAREFVTTTFRLLDSGDLCEVASAFTFGREDLLPSVFERIVESLNRETGGSLDLFRYYLDRHIGLDGDEHGPMAHRLVASLCGEDRQKWQQAEDAAAECLVARRRLWDGIADAIAAVEVRSTPVG